jgi:hypothetical protein
VNAENTPVTAGVVSQDTVTVLRAKGGRVLTKRWRRVRGRLQEESYDNAQRFCGTEHPVTNIHDFGELIQQTSADPQLAIVRGVIADGVDRNDMLRRALPRGAIPATLLPKARWWLGLDLENIPCPPGTDPVSEPEAIVAHVIALLPPVFGKVTCFWQFTSGHGLKPGIRLRLWFWLSRPASDEELRQWLGERVPQDGAPPQEWPRRWPIDPALFNPIQLHFTAAPIFEGLPDPVPRRCGWRYGVEDTVVIPDQAPAEERAGRFSTGAPSTEPGLGYEGWRARIGDHEGGDGFYRPIKSAIGAYFAANGAHFDAAWLVNDLASVVRERQGNRTNAYVEERVRDLPRAVAAIQSRQAAKEREEAERANQMVRFEGDALIHCCSPSALKTQRPDGKQPALRRGRAWQV